MNINYVVALRQGSRLMDTDFLLRGLSGGDKAAPGTAGPTGPTGLGVGAAVGIRRPWCFQVEKQLESDEF